MLLLLTILLRDSMKQEGYPQDGTGHVPNRPSPRFYETRRVPRRPSPPRALREPPRYRRLSWPTSHASSCRSYPRLCHTSGRRRELLTSPGLPVSEMGSLLNNSIGTGFFVQSEFRITILYYSDTNSNHQKSILGTTRKLST
jgi:hypothetical protein